MKTFPKLNIKYSLEDEVVRVRESLKKSEWYRENGYAGVVCLPGGLTLADFAVIPKEDEFLEKLKDEYSEGIYKETQGSTQEAWADISHIWAQRGGLPSIVPFIPEYNVQLTRYGTGGSYSLPNTIIVNIRTKTIKQIPKTIFHEIIHLAIEPHIKHYSIKQWEKERLVDLIFAKTFPEIAFSQKIPEEAHFVDDIFKKYPNDVEATVREISSKGKL